MIHDLKGLHATRLHAYTPTYCTAGSEKGEGEGISETEEARSETREEGRYKREGRSEKEEARSKR